MSRKYLDDINIVPYFDEKEDSERGELFEKNKEIYGFDERETWNLDYSFVVWLYERVSRYRDVAQNVIDLKFRKFEYNGEIKTQMEMINILLDKCKCYIESDNIYSDCLEIVDIWRLIINAMWW